MSIPSVPKTRPGNPDRGWNDPPMFNFAPGQTAGTGQPRRMLNKRVAFPLTNPGGASPGPGHAVLNPTQGPPILNPVLPVEIQGQPVVSHPPALPIGLRDTPLGNQAPPSSPIQILPPTADLSTPQTVPVLVPTLIPVQQPNTEDPTPVIDAATQLDNERIQELFARLSLSTDEELLNHAITKLDGVLDGYKHILTMKASEDIKKKIEILKERWRAGALGDEVKVRTVQLALALSEGRTEKANHLHLALVVDHIAEVNQWIMGVKRLVHQQQLSNKEREIIERNRLNDPNAQESSISEQTDSSVEGGKTTPCEGDILPSTNDHSGEVNTEDKGKVTVEDTNDVISAGGDMATHSVEGGIDTATKQVVCDNKGEEIPSTGIMQS